MRLRSSIVGLIATLLPAAMYAGNPHILIKGDPPNPTIITSDSFSLSANALGGGVFTFQNESGNLWQSLEFTATLPLFTTITCGPGPFTTCTIAQSPVGDNVLYDILFGPAPNGAGIKEGEIFSINLNDQGEDPDGVGSWGAGTTLAAEANTVTAAPEPSSFILFGSGALAMAAIARRRRKTA
jgi:hypothetical protein